MDLGISGKTALVCAASSGLGAGIARALAREGAKVAITGTNPAKLEATLAAIRAEGGTGMALVWDLADTSLIQPSIARIEAELGPIDILVNNTGGPPPSTVAGQAPDLWLRQFQAMVLSVIGITDAVLPGMKARGWGRILTSTSAGVVQPIPNLGLSNTLRAALVGWSKTLSREVAPHGITANIIVPGRIETERLLTLDKAAATREAKPLEAVTAAQKAAIPMGRYGDVAEYADVAAFLVSARASYVTGSVVRVDGGQIASV
jgi:3-oxoacyl-[acyl-carrier protein] reductase